MRVSQLAPSLTKKPALIPTGQLILHKIVPLSGELDKGVGVTGVNLNFLSGMKLEGLSTCLSYAENPSFKFDPDEALSIALNSTDFNHLQIAILRLLITGSHPEAYDEIKKNIRSRLEKMPDSFPLNDEWQKFGYLLESRVNIAKEELDKYRESLFTEQEVEIQCEVKGQFTTELVYPEIERGKVVARWNQDKKEYEYGIVGPKYYWNEYHWEYKIIQNKKGEMKMAKFPIPLDLQEMKPKELDLQEAALIGEQLKTTKERLQDLLKLFDTIKPIKFSSEELQAILEPFPIVWASMTLTPLEILNGVIGERLACEHLVYGKALLTDDIQVVFTNKENQAKLKSLLKDQNVSVLSFETARYLLEKQRDQGCPTLLI